MPSDCVVGRERASRARPRFHRAPLGSAVLLTARWTLSWPRRCSATTTRVRGVRCSVLEWCDALLFAAIIGHIVGYAPISDADDVPKAFTEADIKGARSHTIGVYVSHTPVATGCAGCNEWGGVLRQPGWCPTAVMRYM